jgi:transposase-like protein
MTRNIQVFMQVGDITGIRIRCRDCSATMTAPLGSNAAEILTSRFRCPTCNAEWFANANDPRSQALEKFYVSLIEIRKRSAEFEASGVPIEFMLEISPEDAQRSDV